MKVSYFREMKDHHLVIAAGPVQCPEYQLKMMQQNQIDGLLSPAIRQMDSEIEYDYTITGCQSLQSYVEGEAISGRLLAALIEALCQVLEELERYMLDGDHLALRPEFIYVESRNEMIVSVKYCLFPFRSEKVEEQIRELMKFVLNEMDYQEKRAVDLAYELFQEASQEMINMQTLKTLVQVLKPETKEMGKMETIDDGGIKTEVLYIEASGDQADGRRTESNTEEVLWINDRYREKKPKRSGKAQKNSRKSEITLPEYGKKSILRIIKSGGVLR